MYNVYLDLDNTLIYGNVSDTGIPTKIYKNRYGLYERVVKCEDKYVKIIIRNYFFECLEELHKYADIYVFTAATKEYADAILDVIDKKRRIKKRYYREDCGVNGEKDMSKYKFSKKKTVMIDDRMISFALQPENGILIRPFFGELDMDLWIWTIILRHWMRERRDVREIIYSYNI
jgi:TFIIF-interacting CTD phosphatase-like protein